MEILISEYEAKTIIKKIKKVNGYHGDSTTALIKIHLISKKHPKRKSFTLNWPIEIRA